MMRPSLSTEITGTALGHISLNALFMVQGKYYVRAIGSDASELIKAELPTKNAGDFQGYLINIRREKFKDPRVREALGLAFDFEWMNRQIMFNAYKRVRGFFNASDFEAEGLPGPDELAVLEPLRDKLPAKIFTEPVPLPPSTAPPGSLRKNLLKARDLLTVDQKAVTGLNDNAGKTGGGASMDRFRADGRQIEIVILLRFTGFNENAAAAFAPVRRAAADQLVGAFRGFNAKDSASASPFIRPACRWQYCSSVCGAQACTMKARAGA